MPKLSPADVPTVKLDSASGAIEVSLTREMRRGLFEKPGRTVFAIVELTSKSYTGHAEQEDKDPEVKVRITSCEVARSDEDAAALADAKRAMWRGRQIDGTLDEVGEGPQRPDGALLDVTVTKPSEDELKEHRRRQEQRRRDEYVR
ncbi:hypothetical protein [Streptomyces acidiscabies]|uniref:Uncharacterized protein n=1 Tax=Streptomyces acidiscabies TaxID=42234 RepID=A0AAP6BKW7_9ACTN|nr:hypothetical protein [Streptomyces acidiscabies]MBZ3909397.1 hypothetical protein [Streptomyces acidiscabies]MDX2966627.1 hypothetical protein [Streptomyces acidiscabies]MDX3796597.1 hypothetical protein [Streptomyces acidiscabies]